MKTDLAAHTVAICCVTLLTVVSILLVLLLSFIVGHELNEPQKMMLDMANFGWKAGLGALVAVVVSSRIASRSVDSVSPDTSSASERKPADKLTMT